MLSYTVLKIESCSPETGIDPDFDHWIHSVEGSVTPSVCAKKSLICQEGHLTVLQLIQHSSTPVNFKLIQQQPYSLAHQQLFQFANPVRVIHLQS